MAKNLKKPKFEIHPVVFPVAAGLIVLFVLWGVLAPTDENRIVPGIWALGPTFDSVQAWIVANFSWLYIMAMSGFLVFGAWLAFSRHGQTRLGSDNVRPEFNRLTWFAMLFSAGMGIGLVFWSVAEPLYHFANQDLPGNSGGKQTDARNAMGLSIFHWGLHAWALYAVVALALAYFGFRRGLPLSFRSVFYPVIGDRIHGPLGHIIDVMAVCATLFGVATSLGLGAMQVNAGLNMLFGLEQSRLIQVLLIAGITACATVSVVTGLHAGIRRLSEANMTMAALLMIFVFATGPTVFLLNAFAENIGSYLQTLPSNSFLTGAFVGEEHADWLGDWTVFYWGWWMAWSPFVGMFIARVSKGRTIREFITGVLLVPTAVGAIWLTVFGSGALHQDLHPDADVYADRPVVHEMDVQVTDDNGQTSVEKQELTVVGYLQKPVMNNAGTQPLDSDQRVATVLFVMLQGYPLLAVTCGIATLCIILFFVTSSDSASMVIDIISSGGNQDPPVGTRLFWAITEGVVAAILLVAGGLNALQTASITAALPFSVVIILMCFSLASGLKRERQGLIPDDQKRYAKFGEAYPESTRTESGKQTAHEFDIEKV